MPVVDFNNIMAMGGVGPFGRVFESNDLGYQQIFIDYLPKYHLPQLETPPGTFPMQKDSCNCGVFVILTMMDLIITQYNTVMKVDSDWFD